MADIVEFKSKDTLEAEEILDDVIRRLIKSGDIKAGHQTAGVVMKPAFDKEKIQNVQSCLDLVYDLLESKSNKTAGKTTVSFCTGSLTNVVVKSNLKSLHIEDVAGFVDKFSKADNIDIYPHAKGKTFEFDAKFNHVATPVPVGKDGADNE